MSERQRELVGQQAPITRQATTDLEGSQMSALSKPDKLKVFKEETILSRT